MKRGPLCRGLFFVSVLAICGAGLAYTAERILQRRTGHSWLLNGWSGLGPTIHDPLLGWASPPSTSWPDLYGPGNDCTFNKRGFRALEEYADAIPSGRRRILCLGDSFLAGLGIDDRATIPAQIEALEPEWQAVNMAKISYGIDQAVLRYERDAQGMEADAVLLAVIDDDLNRARWNYFFGYWPKPRFQIMGEGGLELTGTPVPDFSASIRGPVDLFRRSALFLLPARYMAERSYAQDDNELATRILDRLRRTAMERRHRVALAYLPTVPELRAGALLPSSRLLERYAAERSLPFVNVATAFQGLDTEQLELSFLEVNGHYSDQGSRLVAQALAATIEHLGD